MAMHLPVCGANTVRAGEIRGQIVFTNTWDYSRMLYSELSGGSSVPTTPSPAFGAGLVALSNDGTMGVVYLGVGGMSWSAVGPHWSALPLVAPPPKGPVVDWCAVDAADAGQACH